MKMKKCLVAIPLILATSCAGILHGSSDTIVVNSIEKGSKIYVDDAARGLDTASVSVKRGNIHKLRAEKEHCQTTFADTAESFDSASLLGILIDFGIFSIPIDLISGSAWKAEPTTYTVTPICLPS